MKKFLVLIPLLSACAPAFTGTSNPTPFKTGQNWRISSKSALEAKIPASTTFTISEVSKDDDSWAIVGQTSTKSRVSMHYDDSSPALTLAYDYSGVDQDASRLRLCIIAMTSATNLYSGYAAHVPVSKIFKSSDDTFSSTFDSALKKAFSKNANDNSLGIYTLYTKSIAEAVDDSDNAPCTLELLK